MSMTRFVVLFYLFVVLKTLFRFGTRLLLTVKSTLKSGKKLSIEGEGFLTINLNTPNFFLNRDTIKKHLNLPSETTMEYKTHNDALRDNSSFRNTDVFR